MTTKKHIRLTDCMLHDYIIAALFSTTDGDGPLDKYYDRHDIDEKTLDKMRETCQEFLDANVYIIDYLTSHDHQMSQIMHDFWLNCNGHGSGFWDGDYPEEIGEILDTYCDDVGESYLEVFSGVIYLQGEY